MTYFCLGEPEDLDASMQQQSQAGRADSSVGQIYSLPQGPVSPEMSNTEIIGTCWIGEKIILQMCMLFYSHTYFMKTMPLKIHF